MPIEPVRAIAAAALALALIPASALAAPAAAPDNWGEANRQTMAAQIIDPTPEYATQVPESSGAHAQKASERYRTDKVKLPDKLRTSSTQSGGGGGNGGN